MAKCQIQTSKPFLKGFVYRNPAECIEWQERFNSLVDDVTMMNREVILLGDFNNDLLKPKPKMESNLYHAWLGATK